MAQKRQKIALISNPHAGKNTPRAGLGKVIASILAEPRWTYTTETLGELRMAADFIKRDRPDILAFSGGDGTVMRTLTDICQSYERSPGMALPQILVIPTGTMNVVGTSLGLTRMSAETLASTIRAKIDANVPLDTARLSPMKVNDRYGFLYGAGLPINVLEQVYASEHRGPKRIAKIMVRAFWEELWALACFRKSPQILTKPVHAKIIFPNGYEPPVAPYMTHTAILAGSVDQVGLGCRALHDARSKPGCFMIRSTNLGYWGLSRRIGHLWAGLSFPAIYDATVPYVDIEFEQPTDITIDGEIFKGRLHDRISCGPSLTFITG